MATTKRQLHHEIKRNLVIKRLEELNMKEHDGNSIYSLDYNELKMVLVLAEMARVDIEHPEHRWFR